MYRRPAITKTKTIYRQLAAGVSLVGVIGLTSYIHICSNNNPPTPPSPTAYGPAKILNSQDITPPNHKRLTLQVPPKTAEYLPKTLVPYHFNVKNPYISVARSYTPVHRDGDTFQFIIKQYKVGETGKYMHNQSPDSLIEINGPLQHWTLPPPSKDHNATLTMIAGGTGITPFIQVLDAALNNPMDAYSVNARQWPKFQLLYFTSSENEVLDRDWLDRLVTEFPDRVSVRYFTSGRGDINKDVLKQHLLEPGNGLVVVCGPDGFVNAVAGRRGDLLMDQGPLGGYLKQLGYNANEVHKME